MSLAASEGSKHPVFFAKRGARRGAVLVFAAAVSGNCAFAQGAAFLLGNPQAAPNLIASGFLIHPAVFQDTTSTTISYSATPPQAGYQSQLGTVYWDLVASQPVSVSFTVRWFGDLSVSGSWVGGQFTAGFTNTSSESPSPQTLTEMIPPGRGSFTFTMAPSQSGPGIIQVILNVGSPEGARLPYVNDFTGTGQTNYSVWRPSDSGWYVNYKGSGSPLTPIAQWGLPGDVTVPGDYDGDGFSDYAVWRPSQGIWYTLLSSTGQQVTTSWGLQEIFRFQRISMEMEKPITPFGDKVFGL